MYRLYKIKDLRGYRFFQNFRWDEANCRLFNQNNLIYGWNGSGKTTLCDFFKEIENGQLSSTDTKFSLLFEDTSSNAHSIVTQNTISSIPYIFKVFHQNYIQDNISTVDNVKHIFSVGRAQIEKIEEIKKLRSDAQHQKETVKKLEGELTQREETFDKAKITCAKTIKDAARYSNAYNKSKFYNEYRSLTIKKPLTDDEYQKALTAIRAEPRSSIPLFKNSLIQPSVKEYLSDILNQTPVNITIESLKKDVRVSNWAEQGLTIHEQMSSKICFFCGNSISEDRFEKLRAHFNKSYKELSDKIDSAIQLLHEKIKQFSNVKVAIPDAGLLYPELRKQFGTLQATAKSTCDDYIQVISQIIDILTKKKSDMISQQYTDEFVALVDTLSFDYTVFDEILEIIQAHNQKTENFNLSIKNAQRAVEVHLISENADQIAAYEKSVEAKKQELGANKKNLEQLTQQIIDLEQEIKNSQIPADAINKDIEFIMGRNELVFTNSSLGYQITRKGRKAKNLSKGEENAIALIYFFNTFLDVDADAQNTIVILDDPISSFDSNFYYNAISYIREKTSQVGQTFIFTHKFSLLKDYSLMYKGNTNRYTMQRVQDGPQLVDEDKLISQYHDEYAYLFKRVYTFVKQPPSDTSEYLQYPNMARRLLEGFLTFKLPLPNDQCSMIDKVLALEGNKNTAEGRAMLRLLNNRSHLRVIQDSQFADDIDNITILPNTLKYLLEFMRKHDERHYNTLAVLCDPQYDEDGDAVEVEQVVEHTVKLYEMPASAGPGNFLEDNIDTQEITVTNPDCSFAVKISGDSMDPNIIDGSVALVKKCENVPNAHVGIVWYQGKSYCKKIVQKEDGLLLVSINKAYTPIEVTSYEDWRVFGEVIEVIPPN